MPLHRNAHSSTAAASTRRLVGNKYSDAHAKEHAQHCGGKKNRWIRTQHVSLRTCFTLRVHWRCAPTGDRFCGDRGRCLRHGIRHVCVWVFFVFCFNMYVNKVDENSVSSPETGFCQGLFLCYNHGSALQVMFGCVSGLLCCVDERYSLIGNRANDS